MYIKKAIVVCLSAVMLSTTVFATTASAAKPTRVFIKITKQKQACPAPKNIMLYVAGNKPGWVQVQFERKSDGMTTGPFPLQIKKRPANGHVNPDEYRGKLRWTVVFGASINEKYRAIVTGDGKTKKSAYSKLLVKC